MEGSYPLQVAVLQQGNGKVVFLVPEAVLYGVTTEIPGSYLGVSLLRYFNQLQ